MAAVKVTLPVLQIWAPSAGFVTGTAIMVRPSCARRTRQQFERTLSDRRANGEAFEGERVVRRHALVEINKTTSEVWLVLMETERNPR